MEKPLTAIQEAQIAKREIEKYLESAFAKFSVNTGLLVYQVDVEPLETTSLSDQFRKFGAYRVEVELKIP